MLLMLLLGLLLICGDALENIFAGWIMAVGSCTMEVAIARTHRRRPTLIVFIHVGSVSQIWIWILISGICVTQARCCVMMMMVMIMTVVGSLWRWSRCDIPWRLLHDERRARVHVVINWIGWRVTMNSCRQLIGRLLKQVQCWLWGWRDDAPYLTFGILYVVVVEWLEVVFGERWIVAVFERGKWVLLFNELCHRILMDFSSWASCAASMRCRCARLVAFTATAAAASISMTATWTCATHRAPFNPSRCHGLGTQRVVADVASDCVDRRTEFNLVNWLTCRIFTSPHWIYRREKRKQKISERDKKNKICIGINYGLSDGVFLG